MCADLGSRTIREEIAAMEVLGINPVQRLVTPRFLASGLVALLLNSLVVIIGILIIGAIAFVFDLGMRWLERNLVPWKGKV